ncbi:frataxin [Nematocida sp. LUAm3]|nr:frataxin [Nematocida sp. LUAm3]KAI5174664.1 frataxin [Nematocida sp. LUAm2]KAI5177926.1 frataxin [Nematocida sp. LUAm1]
MYLPDTSYERASNELIKGIFMKWDLIPDANVSMSHGVVKAEFPPLGTYVLNRQPSKQEIWLSSPVSGPHHYRYRNNQWIDKREGNLINRITQEIGHNTQHATHHHTHHATQHATRSDTPYGTPYDTTRFDTHTSALE